MGGRWKRYWFGMSITVTLLLFLGMGCYDGSVSVSEASSPPARGEEPRIGLWLEPDAVPPGECALLVWEVEGGDWPVLLGDKEVPPFGQEEVCPSRTTDFELRLETPDGPLSERATLWVGEEPRDRPREPGMQGMGPPFVHFQIVDPEAIPRGTCARLVWEVPPDIGEEWPMFLDGEEVDPMGGMEICPAETTTYRLRVDTPEGPQERELTLRVVGEMGEGPRPEEPMPEEPGMEIPIEFEAAPDAIPPGECTMLFWHVPEGDWTVIIEGQAVPNAGEAKVCPEGTRSYELLVEGPGGPRTATVTVHVGEGAPPEPPDEPGPQPTPQQPQATPRQPQPTPQQPPPPPKPGQKGADIQPTNIFAQPVPKGSLWVDVTNHGPETLDNKKVIISGKWARFSLTNPSADLYQFEKPREFALPNMAPGQTHKINLGWQIDLTTHEYDFTVEIKAKDFTDTNQNNNTISKKIKPGGKPTSQPGGQAQGTDIQPTNIFIQPSPTGSLWVDVTNHGPATLNGQKVEISGKWARFSKTSTADLYQVENAREFALPILAPGQTHKINLGWQADVSAYDYNFTVDVKAKGFTDTKPGNNSISKQFK
jgi:hypothetical protein